jgi:hypothetical protein
MTGWKKPSAGVLAHGQVQAAYEDCDRPIMRRTVALGRCCGIGTYA